MAHCPTPILIVSASTNRGELFKTYDALAAGALDLARRIDARLPRAQNPDLEDDEDFAWYSALHRLALGEGDASAVARAAEALVATGSGYLTSRGELLRAIATCDANAFDDALAELTREWREGIEEQRGRMRGRRSSLFHSLASYNPRSSSLACVYNSLAVKLLLF
jgi:hypothetical protein